ncbi:MAG: nuclear transport factor 2 family protein [Chitinophagaceae bacterium]
MKHYHRSFLLLPVLFCFTSAHSQSDDLYRKITELDSIFFKAYNECDIAKQEATYSDSIEFYHDKGGLSTSKKDLIEATKKNICGKVTRELVKGSIEVSPIPGYGAVEVGMHLFHNKQEPDAIPKPSRFIIIWRNKDNKWTITRVISLHS